MTEQEEIKLIKLITSHCKKNNNNFVITEMFELIGALEKYFNNKQNGKNTKS